MKFIVDIVPNKLRHLITILVVHRVAVGNQETIVMVVVSIKKFLESPPI